MLVADSVVGVSSGEAAIPVAPPENPQAHALYTEGCQNAKMLNYPMAREMLEKAVSIEPQNMPAHIPRRKGASSSRGAPMPALMAAVSQSGAPSK